MSGRYKENQNPPSWMQGDFQFDRQYGQESNPAGDLDAWNRENLSLVRTRESKTHLHGCKQTFESSSSTDKRTVLTGIWMQVTGFILLEYVQEH